MTEIERKALAWVNEVADYPLRRIDDALTRELEEALCRAIERIEELEATERDCYDCDYAKSLMELQEKHEAFRREVSDAVEEAHRVRNTNNLNRFIIPKPVDPFVALVGEAVWNDPNEPDAVDCAAAILAGLKTRGLEVRKIGEGE